MQLAVPVVICDVSGFFFCGAISVFLFKLTVKPETLFTPMKQDTYFNKD